MNESKRTLIFVAAAVVSIGAASLAHYAVRPKQDAEYAGVGTEFYPDFADPTKAQVLRVVAYDNDTASAKEFKVEYRDGKWRIPSHHNYPADGKDRLAQTAASVIGISRGALVTRRKAEHVRYNVVDPEDSETGVLKGGGQKITLSTNDGTVLADYIIGKKVADQTDVYYVRSPRKDGDAVYLAKVKIDLSTKFGDWIEPDLLQLDRDHLTDIRIDNHSIDERQMAIVPGEVEELKRKATTDPWTFVGLNPKTEELKTDVVNRIVSSLDDLSLVGVRPKPPGIRPDLSLDPAIADSREAILILQNDMFNRGYAIAKVNGKPHLYSKEGELDAGTNEGVRYALHFGQIFTGTEFEIETGLSKDGKEKDAKNKDADSKKKDAGKDADAKKKVSKDAAKTADDAKGDNPDGKSKDQLKKSRYLMVYAAFDPKLCGEPPVKPTEPKKPPGVVLDNPADGKTTTPAPAKPDAQKPDSKKPDAPKAGGAPAAPGKAANPASNDSTKPAPPGKAAPPAGGKTDDDQSALDAFSDPSRFVPVSIEVAQAEAPPTPNAKGTAPAPKAAPAPPAKAASAPGAGKAPPSTAAPGPSTPAVAPKPGANGASQPKGPAAPPPDPKAEYLKAMAQYKKDLERFENDRSDYEKKLKDGQEKVKKLNERFGPWYYVISAESFEKLHVPRSALVGPKQKPEDKAKSGSDSPHGNLPGGMIPGLPGGPPGGSPE